MFTYLVKLKHYLKMECFFPLTIAKSDLTLQNVENSEALTVSNYRMFHE